MKNKVNDILEKYMNPKDFKLDMCTNEILSLLNDIPRYSVSLVYVKNIANGQEIALRSFITDANSKEEALGGALIYFTDEMKNYNLSNKVVLKHN